MLERSDNPLSDEAKSSQFGRTISGNCFDISNIEFSRHDVMKLLEFLNDHPEVTDLKARHSQFNHNDIHLFAENRTLTSLDLQDSHCGTMYKFGRYDIHSAGCNCDYINHWATTLAKTTTLHTLNLSRHDYNLPGIKPEALAELLKSTSIRSLQLRRHRLDDVSAAQFVKSNLIELDVSVNNIGAAGAQHLSDSKLERLNVSYNSIDDKGVSDLANSPTLISLIYRSVPDRPYFYNSYINKGIESLAKNKTMTYLDLSGHHILDPIRLLQNRTITTFIHDKVTWSKSVGPVNFDMQNLHINLSGLESVKHLGENNVIYQEKQRKIDTYTYLSEGVLDQKPLLYPQDVLNIVGGYLLEEKPQVEVVKPLGRFDKFSMWVKKGFDQLLDNIRAASSSIAKYFTSPPVTEPAIINMSEFKTDTVAITIKNDAPLVSTPEEFYTGSLKFFLPAPDVSSQLAEALTGYEIEEVEAKTVVSYLKLAHALSTTQATQLQSYIQQSVSLASIELLENGCRIKVNHVSQDDLRSLIKHLAPSTAHNTIIAP